MSLRQITLSYTEETRPILLRRLEDQVRTGEQMWLDYDPWREDEIVVQFESLVYGIRGCPTGPCPLDLTCSLPLHRLLGPLSQDEPRWMMAAWLAVHLVRARLTEDLVCQLVDGTRLSASDLTLSQMATLQGVMVGGRRVPVDTVELRETGIALHYRHPETGESSTELIPGNP